MLAEVISGRSRFVRREDISSALKLGVFPIVWLNLDEATKSNNKDFEAIFLLNVGKVLFNIEVTRLIVDELANFEPVVLKGFIWSKLFWENLFARMAGDIDILIQKEHIPEVLTRLYKMGFTPIGKSYFKRGRTRHVSLSGLSVVVEVHSSIFTYFHFERVPSDYSFAYVDIRGHKFRTLDINWMFIHLLTNALKYAFNFRCICDLYGFLLRHKVDYVFVSRLIHNLKFELATSYALTQVEMKFKTDLTDVFDSLGLRRSRIPTIPEFSGKVQALASFAFLHGLSKLRFLKFLLPFHRWEVWEL